MNKLFSLLQYLFYFPARLLISTKLVSSVDKERELDLNKPILYLLKTRSTTDFIALDKALKESGLPSAFGQVDIEGESFNRSIAIDKAVSVLSSKQHKADAEESFLRLFKLQIENMHADIQIVPVSVFWGRSPEHNTDQPGKLFWGAVTSPSWLSKLFVVLFSGRNSFVEVSPFVSSHAMVTEKSTDHSLAHKMLRVARVHFRRKQNSVIGPTQFNRQQLYFRILKSATVKQAIEDEMKNGSCTKEQATKKANKYFEEIAADFRPGMIGVFEWFLTQLWNKIYSGIEVRNFDKVREEARKGHEIVYVPCHRSHMDYLLLTYVIYHQGLMTPHIAAGVNLNFWPAGPIFRRAGAFFIRRTFRGNRLYTAIFREYLDQLFTLGYPVKYFCEGGRSRTGRLLTPKTGMLAMTVQSVLRGVDRPVTFVPVYIGYEHVMEVASYLKELRGNEKKKESIGQIFSAIRQLRNFGLGYVSFGEPLSLNQFLSQQEPTWKQTDLEQESKPQWLNPAVTGLAQRVQIGINQAAAVNPVALVSLCLLASNKRALGRDELVRQLDCYLRLLRAVPYNDNIYVSDDDAETVLNKALAHNKFEVLSKGGLEIVRLDDTSAIAMTYYRNNIKHLFVIPGLIASKIIAGAEKKQIQQFLEQLYPVLKNEWFIEVDDLAAYVDAIIAEFKAQGLAEQKGRKLVAAEVESNQYFELALLARTVQDTLQRYAIVLSLIDRSEQISRVDLEKQSQSLAQKLSALHGVNAPEFFDKKVIATKVAGLKDKGIISLNEEGNLIHNEESTELMHTVMALVDFEVRQTIAN